MIGQLELALLPTAASLTALFAEAGIAPQLRAEHGTLFTEAPAVGVPGPCLVWVGTCTSGGYGNVWRQGCYALVHNIALELCGYPIGSASRSRYACRCDRRVADHLCHNRPCATPRHLEIVTNGENIWRGSGKYPAEILALAPRFHCPECGTPLRPSIDRYKAAWQWKWWTTKECRAYMPIRPDALAALVELGIVCDVRGGAR